MIINLPDFNVDKFHYVVLKHLTFLEVFMINNFKLMIFTLFVLFSFSFLYSGDDLSRIYEILPEGSILTYVDTQTIAGKKYYLIKYLNEDDSAAGLILDENMKEIDYSEIPLVSEPKLSRDIIRILDDKSIDEKEEIAVIVGFRSPEVSPEELIYYEEVAEDIVFGENTFTFIEEKDGNVRLIDSFELDLINAERYEINLMNNETIREKRRSIFDEFAKRNNFTDYEVLNMAIERNISSIIISIAKNDIEYFLEKNDDLIVAIEKYHGSTQELANAMIATSVDPYVLNYTSRQGDGIGVYVTEVACPSPGFTSRYHRWSAGSTHPQHMGHVQRTTLSVRGVSPLSFIYCRADVALPTTLQLNGLNPGWQYVGPPVKIINSSNCIGSCGEGFWNNNYNIPDRDWDNYSYANNVAIFNSAGNQGVAGGQISSPGKGLNIITVGNYCRPGQVCNSDPNASMPILMNFTINPGSSYVNPETKNQKPEISAPGTLIALSGEVTWSGTSLSCPHAAGIAADFMGMYSWLKDRPYYMKAFMLASATDNISGGSNKVGVGGIDFYDGAFDGTGARWESSSSSQSVWNNWDNADPLPGNGRVDYTFYVNAANSKVTVALAWMNRGTHTFDHKAAFAPSGIDLDLYVYAPNGSLVGISTSAHNGYEVVSFNPTVSGTYRASIIRYDVRDSQSKMHMGIRINRD